MSSIVVRPFQPEDLPACREIFSKVHLDYRNPMLFINYALNSDMSDVQTSYLNIPNGNWWVAVSADGQQILGHVAALPLKVADPAYYREVPVEERDRICELRRMAVAPNAQRNGVGKKLLSTLMDFARDKGYQQIHLTTLRSMPKACAFYERNDFVKGRLERFLFDQMDLETEEDLKKFFRNPPKPVIFESNSALSDEDLQRLNEPPEQSGFIYVQHYSILL